MIKNFRIFQSKYQTELIQSLQLNQKFKPHLQNYISNFQLAKPQLFGWEFYCNLGQLCIQNQISDTVFRRVVSAAQTMSKNIAQSINLIHIGDTEFLYIMNFFLENNFLNTLVFCFRIKNQFNQIYRSQIAGYSPREKMKIQILLKNILLSTLESNQVVNKQNYLKGLVTKTASAFLSNAPNTQLDNFYAENEITSVQAVLNGLFFPKQYNVQIIQQQLLKMNGNYFNALFGEYNFPERLKEVFFDVLDFSQNYPSFVIEQYTKNENLMKPKQTFMLGNQAYSKLEIKLLDIEQPAIEQKMQQKDAIKFNMEPQFAGLRDKVIQYSVTIQQVLLLLRLMTCGVNATAAWGLHLIPIEEGKENMEDANKQQLVEQFQQENARAVEIQNRMMVCQNLMDNDVLFLAQDGKGNMRSLIALLYKNFQISQGLWKQYLQLFVEQEKIIKYGNIIFECNKMIGNYN